MKSWKTTVAGLALPILGFATAMHWITIEVAGAIGTLAVSLGLMSAKDNNVTGGTKHQ